MSLVKIKFLGIKNVKRFYSGDGIKCDTQKKDTCIVEVDEKKAAQLMIDHPEVMREVCLANKPYPTHPRADLMIKDKKVMSFLDSYSKKIKKITKKPLKERYSHFIENRCLK